MSDSQQKRRRHRRVDATFDVRISSIEPERDPWTGRTLFRATREVCGNVSRGGAFVKSTTPLPPGRRVLVELKLPEGGRLEAIGRVAWTRRTMTPRGRQAECAIGIEFLGGGSEHLKRLERFLDDSGDSDTVGE